MGRKIYILGGLLYPRPAPDRDIYDKFQTQIEKRMADSRLNSAEFQIVSISSCTVEQFKEIWQSPDTVGIIWLGHGYKGILGTNETSSLFHPNKIDPRLLPKSGYNIRFLILSGCDAEDEKATWKKRLSRSDVNLQAVDGDGYGNAGPVETLMEKETYKALEMFLPLASADVIHLDQLTRMYTYKIPKIGNISTLFDKKPTVPSSYTFTKKGIQFLPSSTVPKGANKAISGAKDYTNPNRHPSMDLIKNSRPLKPQKPSSYPNPGSGTNPRRGSSLLDENTDWGSKENRFRGVIDKQHGPIQPSLESMIHNKARPLPKLRERTFSGGPVTEINGVPTGDTKPDFSERQLKKW
jgi:hypothetical protein